MKKQKLPILLAVTLIFAAFTAGFFLGRNHNHTEVQLSVPASLQTAPSEPTEATQAPPETAPAITFPININTATEEELMALPGIGQVLAGRILAYREEHGDFKTPEGLLNVEGIGEKRMEDILDLITIGG